MTNDFESIDWEHYETLIAANGITIDRPYGHAHPHFPEIIYPIDYGYINDTVAEDNEGIDVFVGSGAKRLVGLIHTTDHRKGDREIKLLYACTPGEVYLTHGFINYNPALMQGTLHMRFLMSTLWQSQALTNPCPDG
jgi:inorganic pyrophosphatase